MKTKTSDISMISSNCDFKFSLCENKIKIKVKIDEMRILINGESKRFLRIKIEGNKPSLAALKGICPTTKIHP